MTHITNYKTKTAFKKAVAADPKNVFVSDPSIFDPISGTVFEIIAAKGRFTVTNHPKRSWFCEVYRGRDGSIKVK